MAKYVQVARVQRWLENKVRFGAPGDQDPNKMSLALLNELIDQAEAQLEIDLMLRYEIPLQGPGGTFAELPSTTRTQLSNLAETLSAVRVLEIDFGKGTSANADKYTEWLTKRYEKMVEQLVAYKDKSYRTWKIPPLPGLMLSYNNGGDTGFAGRIHNTTTISREPDYAYKQINSPGENLFNGWLDPLDNGSIWSDGNNFTWGV